MPEIVPCSGCGAVLDCESLPDSLLFNLQDRLPFLLNCPTSYVCNFNNFTLLCCNTQIPVSIPNGSTPDQQLAIVTQAIRQCLLIGATCGQVGNTGHGGPPGGPVTPPPVNPDEPTIFYCSQPETCSVKCPDGSDFTYTLQAGKVCAFTPSLANQLAHTLACSQATIHRICLSDLVTSWCEGVAFSQSIGATGSTLDPYANQWTLTAGSLPPGLSFPSEAGPILTISGTPNTAGTYTFTIQVQTPSGDVKSKSYTICIVGINPSSFPNGTMGTAYSQTLTATSCATPPLSWQVTSGALPTGLFLNEETGVISGTPTGTGTFNFTIELQTEST